ncbi:MAG: hypothetical protein PHR35_16310, partial [Kiritimatiellae bacterium]|nr:hypothetical protein [Kiritimatiellia bacterium]
MRAKHGTSPMSTDAAVLHAGVARGDITNRARGAAVRDPLYAKALVLDDDRTRLAIVAMDTTAVGGRAVSGGILGDGGEAFLPDLRARISKELGIPGGNVLVNASHTHPPGRILCGDREQVRRTFEAVRQAARSLVPVRIGVGSGREERIAINRDLRLRDGRHWSLRHSNPTPPDEEVAGVGPTDPEIGVLRIERLDGRPLALVYNFACHPLWGDLQGGITANFPGVASRLIEEQLGHGAMAIFLQGAGGNICDVDFKEFGRPRDVEP